MQPTAIAGAIFFASMAIGKFHGVMAAATPTGRRWTRTFLPGTNGISSRIA